MIEYDELFKIDKHGKCLNCHKNIKSDNKFCNKSCYLNYRSECLNKLNKHIDCLECDKTFSNTQNLRTHIIRHHGIEIQNYYDKYISTKQIICPCGNKTTFISLNSGYNKVCCVNCGDKYKITFYKDVAGINGSNYGNIGNFHHSEEFKHKQRINAINNKIGKRDRTHDKIRIFDEHFINQSKENAKRLHEIGFENKGGKCSWFDVGGFVVQGKYELYYYLINYKDAIITKPIRYKTPYGWYSPDFELENCFVEIKSDYTFKLMALGKQIKKIKWLSRNVKSVKIIVLKDEVIKNYFNTNVVNNSYKIHRASR